MLAWETLCLDPWGLEGLSFHFLFLAHGPPRAGSQKPFLEPCPWPLYSGQLHREAGFGGSAAASLECKQWSSGSIVPAGVGAGGKPPGAPISLLFVVPLPPAVLLGWALIDLLREPLCEFQGALTDAG